MATLLLLSSALTQEAPPPQTPTSHAPLLSTQSLERAFPALSFDRPIFLTHASDRTDRVFVVLQRGRIAVFPNDQAVASTSTFLDIEERVSSRGNEEGLLGLAFDPAYGENGYFYVYYTAAAPRRSVLSRFTTGPGPGVADPASELVLLETPQPYQNHNGGMIAFGPDGYLYVGLGDGGSRGDPGGNGQDLGTLLGTILRLDVRGATAERPYAVPPDNPFVGVAGARPEIWAYGLRNPWRFSFDAASSDAATGVLWALDVGQNAFEEVDLIERGGNYGWNITEGFACYLSAECDRGGLTPPVYAYGHDLGCSGTGGYVYRGSRAYLLTGAYVYADFCSGRVWALRHDGERVVEHLELLQTGFRIPSFGEDGSGELYILGFDGAIYHFAQEKPTEETPAPAPAASAQPDALVPPGSPRLSAWGVAALVAAAAGAAGIGTVRHRRRRLADNRAPDERSGRGR